MCIRDRVVVERYGLLALVDQVVVQDVEHLKKRGVCRDVLDFVPVSYTHLTRYVVPLRDRMFRYAQSLLLCADEAEDVTHDLLELSLIHIWSARP